MRVCAGTIFTDISLTGHKLLLRQILQQQTFQLLRLNRLRKKTMKSLAQIHFPRPRNCIGRQCDHRHRTAGWIPIRLQAVQRLNAVQIRHHMIQKNQIIPLRLRHGKTLQAAARLIHLHFRRFQQIAKDSAVHGIIIHNQKLRIRRSQQSMISIILRLPADTRFQIADRLRMDNPLFQSKIEIRPLPIDALHLQTASHQLQQLSRNAHAKPSALNPAVSLLLNPFKFREQLR